MTIVPYDIQIRPEGKSNLVRFYVFPNIQPLKTFHFGYQTQEAREKEVAQLLGLKRLQIRFDFLGCFAETDQTFTYEKLMQLFETLEFQPEPEDYQELKNVG